MSFSDWINRPMQIAPRHRIPKRQLGFRQLHSLEATRSLPHQIGQLRM